MKGGAEFRRLRIAGPPVFEWTATPSLPDFLVACGESAAKRESGENGETGREIGNSGGNGEIESGERTEEWGESFGAAKVFVAAADGRMKVRLRNTLRSGGPVFSRRLPNTHRLGSEA
ncbi:unnamed protein product [Bursaphelenchus xylophilus]|uniref:(pine wood nematode) hypothetical protein n=1 Tax=Bursaphelenchus xylophilus TaxID=6326 RepID=A0A1I7RV03_BURXY|nr:unnamed protein product [Bursaphelenchus xylophilus]CAG9105245.1 unnamed protein product [Bursaphelenchus xylophilus]